MKKLLLLSLLTGCVSILTGCDFYFENDGNGRPDASPTFPDARPFADAGACLSDGERINDCSFSWQGNAVDFVSQEPVAADVEVHTAWDNIPLFPANCAPLTDFTVTTELSTFSGMPCDSPQFPPIVLFRTGAGAADGLHPFAVDARLTCGSSLCNVVELPIPTLTDAAALQWRVELAADGMQNAETAGLAIVQFLELDGTPAAGVAPTIREGTATRLLTPASEVRFLAGNRASLVRFDASMTGISGLAIVQVAQPAALIGGVRGGEVWEPIGVLFADGHVFFEERTVTP